MRGKAKSGKKSVQPGKQMVATPAHHRGVGREARPAKSKSLSRALATRGSQSLVELNPQQLIFKAISKGDISIVEKLLQIQRDLKAQTAKKQYILALARFQMICPPIQKTKKVEFTTKKGTKVTYFYAPLDKIIKAVHEPLAECGFSYMIKGDQTEKQYTAIVESYHAAGHCEVSRFSVPIVDGDFMGVQQSVASAQSFAKRQVFCNAYGIVTHDMDDDARAAGLQSENGAKAATAKEAAQRNVSPGTLPENPGIQTVEKLLKQMPWLPEATAAMYRKQMKTYSEKNDATSMRGLQQALNKQIATKGAKK